MTKNIHSLERRIRIIGGLLIASLAFWGPSNPLFLIGLIPVLTGLSGWCPAYTMLGVSTCKHVPKKENKV